MRSARSPAPRPPACARAPAGAHQRARGGQRLRDHPAGDDGAPRTAACIPLPCCEPACRLPAPPAPAPRPGHSCPHAGPRAGRPEARPRNLPRPLTPARFCFSLQGFNWESCKEPWYKKLAGQVGGRWCTGGSLRAGSQAALAGSTGWRAKRAGALLRCGLRRGPDAAVGPSAACTPTVADPACSAPSASNPAWCRPAGGRDRGGRVHRHLVPARLRLGVAAGGRRGLGGPAERGRGARHCRAAARSWDSLLDQTPNPDSAACCGLPAVRPVRPQLPAVANVPPLMYTTRFLMTTARRATCRATCTTSTPSLAPRRSCATRSPSSTSR